MSWLSSIFTQPTMVEPDLAPADSTASSSSSSTMTSDDAERASYMGLPRRTHGDDEEIAEHYYEYAQIEPDVYFVRRLGSRRMHYLVTEEHRAYQWCARLEREVRSERVAERRRKPVDAMETPPTSVPGIVGAFVCVGLGEPPVFAFEQPSGMLVYRDPKSGATSNPLYSALLHKPAHVDRERVHLREFTLTGNSGPFVPPIERGTSSPSNGSSNRSPAPARTTPPPPVVDGMVVVDLSPKSTTSTPASTPTPAAPVFTSVSPIDADDTSKRWFVIAEPYWILFRAFEKLHFISGCYLLARQRNNELRNIDAAAARELESFSAQHIQWLALEHLMRRLSDPGASDEDRLALIAQGTDALTKLDTLRRERMAQPNNS